MTSQPCKNDASCVSLNPTESIRNSRFTCKCRPGYQGVYCEHPIRSCLGYNKTKNDVYHVTDSNDKVFPVFCNFRISNGKIRVFNLIQSYKWNEKQSFNDSLINQNPVNEEDPRKTPYRLSLPRMDNIRKHFTKWRIEFSKTENNGSHCWKNVEVDVRQRKCTSCLAHATWEISNGKAVTDKIINESECNSTHNESNYCELSINNYGLYCCIGMDNINNDAWQYCQPNTKTKIKIWLFKLIN